MATGAGKESNLTVLSGIMLAVQHSCIAFVVMEQHVHYLAGHFRCFDSELDSATAACRLARNWIFQSTLVTRAVLLYCTALALTGQPVQ